MQAARPEEPLALQTVVAAIPTDWSEVLPDLNFVIKLVPIFAFILTLAGVIGAVVGKVAAHFPPPSYGAGSSAGSRAGAQRCRVW